MCMDRLQSGAFLPQGVGGSATAQDYAIGGQPAADRNIVLTSWYSRQQERGLFAGNRAGQSVTQLMVMDLDRRRYNTIELVRPVGSGKLQNLNSHGSGLVWAGQYLYSSSRSVLWMYNADDILEIDGRFVLPAVARWTVAGSGGLSSISIDRSTIPSRLIGINYAKGDQSYVQSFDLDADGRLAAGAQRARHELVLRNSFGHEQRVLPSSRSLTLPGASYQGVGAAGPHGFANSSATQVGRARAVDGLVIFKNSEVIGKFRMPRGNVESIYIDYVRGTYVSITEHGSQFLFQIPLGHLTERAEQ